MPPPPTSLKAPIDVLPVEVLLMVFHVFTGCIGSPAELRLRGVAQQTVRSLLLTQVCRRWRKLAVHEPVLWTGVHITRWSNAPRLFFKRSSPLPIGLSINVSSISMSAQATRNVARSLVKEFNMSLRHDTHPVTYRIRYVRLVTKGPSSALLFALSLQKFGFPKLASFFVRTTGEELTNRPEPKFKPPLPESLASLTLYQLSRGLTAEALRGVFASCPRLQILVLGILELTGRQLQIGQTEPTKIHAPALKTLVVASPIFATHYRNMPCTPGCPCVFSDILAPNLDYLEVAGDVSEGLTHLTHLIHRRAPQSRADGFPKPLKVMINAGGRPFFNFSPLLRSVSPSIHLHLFSSDLGFYASDHQSWICKTRSTTFYVKASSSGDRLRPLASFPHLEPLWGGSCEAGPGRGVMMVPVLIHPTIGHPFLAEASIRPGPYHDPHTLTLR